MINRSLYTHGYIIGLYDQPVPTSAIVTPQHSADHWTTGLFDGRGDRLTLASRGVFLPGVKFNPKEQQGWQFWEQDKRACIPLGWFLASVDDAVTYVVDPYLIYPSPRIVWRRQLPPAGLNYLGTTVLSSWQMVPDDEWKRIRDSLT